MRSAGRTHSHIPGLLPAYPFSHGPVLGLHAAYASVSLTQDCPSFSDSVYAGFGGKPYNSSKWEAETGRFTVWGERELV